MIFILLSQLKCAKLRFKKLLSRRITGNIARFEGNVENEGTHFKLTMTLSIKPSVTSIHY
jgi:hypothetical protein